MRIPNVQIVNTTSMDASEGASGHVRMGEVYWTPEGEVRLGNTGDRARSQAGGVARGGGTAITAASCRPLAISTFRFRAGIGVRDSEYQNCDTHLE